MQSRRRIFISLYKILSGERCRLLLLDEPSRCGELAFVKKENLYKPYSLFKEALWVVKIKLEAEERVANCMSIHLLLKVGVGGGAFLCVSPQGCKEHMVAYASDTVLWDSQPPFSLPGWCQTETGPVAVSASPQYRQLWSPGVIAHICFFSLPGLGKCARNGCCTV